MKIPKLCSKECSQCLFTENRIVTGEVAAEKIKSMRKNQTHFWCHKGTLKDENWLCRGYYDRFKDEIPHLHEINLEEFLSQLDPDTGQIIKQSP